MAQFRNIQADQHPRRLSQRYKCNPVVYDAQGWEIPRTTPPPSQLMTTTLSVTASVAEPTDCENQFPARGESRRLKDHIPRPRNSFIFFRSDYYRRVKRTSGGHDQNNISKEAGKAWKELTSEERKPYEDMARKEKLDHGIKYPTYSYAPARERRPGKRKAESKKQPKTSNKRARLDNQMKPIIPPSIPRVHKNIRHPTPITPPQLDLYTHDVSELSFDSSTEDRESSIEFNFSWPSASTPGTSVSRDPSPGASDKCPSEYDLSLRPSSYDSIPEAFGFRPSMVSHETDGFLPDLLSFEDVESFMQEQYPQTEQPSTPPPTHTDWDFMTIAMSSQGGDYNFDWPDLSLGYKSISTTTEDMFDIWSTTSTTELDVVEMSQYFNFN